MPRLRWYYREVGHAVKVTVKPRSQRAKCEHDFKKRRFVNTRESEIWDSVCCFCGVLGRSRDLCRKLTKSSNR